MWRLWSSTTWKSLSGPSCSQSNTLPSTSDRTLMARDLAGQEKARPLWKHYFSGTNIVIFVVAPAPLACLTSALLLLTPKVDSADDARIDEAKQELDLLLDEDELRDAALLVFLNKQVVPSPPLLPRPPPYHPPFLSSHSLPPYPYLSL